MSMIASRYGRRRRGAPDNRTLGCVLQPCGRGDSAGCSGGSGSNYSGVRLTGRIAGFFEEVPAFVGAEQGADVAQGGPERLECARRRAAQMRFELGKRHLDWVQIGRVLRQEQEPGAPRLERL